MKPTPRQTWNRPPLRSLKPAPVKTESWWLTPQCQQDRAEFQAECERRHPSGKNETYRRIS